MSPSLALGPSNASDIVSGPAGGRVLFTHHHVYAAAGAQDEGRW